MSHAPFSDVESLVRFVRWNQSQDSDNIIVIDGAEGTGKSTLAIKLALAISPNDFEPEFQVIYNMADWNRVYSPSIRGKTFVLDEGSNILFSRDFASGENKKLIKLLMQIRQCNHNIIVCIPNFNWIDIYLREERMKIRINTYRNLRMERGYANVAWRVYRRDGDSYMEWCDFLIRFGSFPATSAIWQAYIQRKRYALGDAFPQTEISATSGAGQASVRRKRSALEEVSSEFGIPAKKSHSGLRADSVPPL